MAQIDEVFFFVSWIYKIPLHLYVPLVVLGAIIFAVWYFWTFQKMTTPGKLAVFIREGSNLAPKDRGSADPFVRVQIGDVRRDTQVIKANLSPIWNENLVFDIKKEDEFKKIVITVWDWDRLSRNDSLGEISPISMGSVLLRLGHPHPCKNRFGCHGGQWYALKSHKGQAASGKIFIRFHYVEGASA